VVGIVIVSHSSTLAVGVRDVAAEMAGPDVKLELAGGLAEEGTLGTDAVRVMEAIGRADSGDGMLVLMDLASDVLSAETALDFVEPEQRESVLLCEAPLVEGAVAAAVASNLGQSLTEVAKEARGRLQGKAAQLGAASPRSRARPVPQLRSRRG
jgi:PTS hybrid protein